MGKENKAVIVTNLRTPFSRTSMPSFGKTPGKLGNVDPVDLIVPLVNEAVKRTNIDPADVTKLLTGCVHQEAEQGLNLARLVVIHDQCVLPDKVGGTSVDRFCGSSMEAIALADALIARNPDAVYMCTGVQSMSKVDMGGSKPYIGPHVFGGNVKDFANMGLTAENLTQLYRISRNEQDDFAFNSHVKAARAQDQGYFNNEIVPVGGMTQDDGVRRNTSRTDLDKLTTVFKPEANGGTVTAANASQISDGASLVMVTSEAFAKKNSLPVLAEIVSFGESGCKPKLMGIGPVEAAKQALDKAGLTMGDIDALELNEAFAVQALAVLKEWENQGMKIDEEKVNIDGGAIALGHPLGASGARLVGHVAEIINRKNKEYGLATMCIGGGQGVAMIVKNVNYVPD
jgi:acetyl-CoA acyltransferase